MKNIFYLLFVLPLLCSCGGSEYDYIRYKAKDVEFSEVLGEPVYLMIDFGNLKDPYAVHARLGDEKGYNVFGKLFGGTAGLNSLVEGKYKIENGYVLIEWEKQNVIDDLPRKLKITLDDFDAERLTSDVTSLKDEEGISYLQYEYGDGKM